MASFHVGAGNVPFACAVRNPASSCGVGVGTTAPAARGVAAAVCAVFCAVVMSWLLAPGSGGLIAQDGATPKDTAETTRRFFFREGRDRLIGGTAGPSS